MERKPEVKREVRFDERRKELHVIATEERPFEVGGENFGNVVIESKAVYNEKGIRQIYKDSQTDRANTEQAIKRLKDTAGKEPTKEELEELKLHNEKQKKLKRIGDYENNKKNLAAQEEKLKEVKTAIDKIRSAIGTRLKL